MLQPSDPLLLQKAAVLTILSGDGNCEHEFEITISAAEPTAAAAVLRLGHLCQQTEPELAGPLGEWRTHPATLWGRLQRPLSADNERKVSEYG